MNWNNTKLSIRNTTWVTEFSKKIT